MKKLVIGTSGMQISVLGLGTMYFGSRLDEKTSFRLLDLYVEHGGNFLDSANKYASWVPGFQGGESENLIGKWLKQHHRKKDMVLSSKVGFPYGDLPRSLKKEIIISECEKSLKRLGVETIDLYFAHAFDPDTRVEETMEAFYHLKKSGKIRLAGASNFPGWRLLEANLAAREMNWEGFCCLQQRHTYLEPSIRADFSNQVILTPEIGDLCREHHITIMAYSPLLGGLYAKPDLDMPLQYRSGINERKLATLRKLSEKTGHTSNQLVLAWMLHSSPPVIPVIAASNELQLKENLVAGNIVLNGGAMEELEDS